VRVLHYTWLFFGHLHLVSYKLHTYQISKIKGRVLHMLLEVAQNASKVQGNIIFDSSIYLEKSYISTKGGTYVHLLSKFEEHLFKNDFMYSYLRSLVYIQWSFNLLGVKLGKNYHLKINKSQSFLQL